MSTSNIHNLSLTDLQDLVQGWGLKRFTSDQIVQWLYRDGVSSFDEMSNLSQANRERLKGQFLIGRLEAETILKSTDGSEKFLFKLQDGAKIESVLMPQKNDRLTLCISTQVGCAMGCDFCATAKMRLKRNLTAGEILEQVIEARRTLTPDPSPATGRGEEEKKIRKITNIVFMGMGEPFHNYDNVIQALTILRETKAFGFGKRKITVSTVGLVPQIEKFGKDSDVKLAVSLNGSDDVFREGIMPVNKKYPMEALQKACRTYNDLTGQTITIEYVIFAGLNDQPADAKRLVRFLSKLNAKINLIPFNGHPGSPYQRPTDEDLIRFQHALADHKFQVNIRYSKGLDIAGACGQLATSSVLSS